MYYRIVHNSEKLEVNMQEQGMVHSFSVIPCGNRGVQPHAVVRERESRELVFRVPCIPSNPEAELRTSEQIVPGG